jgi:hypothetical protein
MREWLAGFDRELTQAVQNYNFPAEHGAFKDLMLFSLLKKGYLASQR